MLSALGDWNGGFALYVKGSRLVFCFCPAGESVTVTSRETLPVGAHVLGVTCRPGPGGTVLTLTCDGEVIGESTATVAIPNVFQHGGTHLTIGYDDRLPVSDDYQLPFRWAGPIERVVAEGNPAPSPSERTVTDAMHID